MADLIFDSILLTNFKSYREQTTLVLDKSAGLYHVTGDNKYTNEGNGAGKTTLFDALLWCLFGKTGRDSKPGAAISPWKGKKETVVDVRITRGKDTFRITRQRNPNHLFYTTCKWMDVGGWVADTAKEITQEQIPPLLGMSEELFRRTIMASQTAVLFLDLRPDAQAQMFSEALNLDIWLKAADLAAKQAKKVGWDVQDLEGNKQVCERLIASHSKLYEATKQKAEQEEDRIGEQIDNLETEVEALNHHISKARKKLGKAPALPTAGNKRIGAILDELKEIADNTSRLKHQAGRKHKPIKCSECGQSTNQALLDANLEIETEAAALEKGLRDEMEQLQKARSKSDQTYQAAMDEWRDKEREVIKMEAERSAFEAQIERLDKTPNPHKQMLKDLVKAHQENKQELEVIQEKLDVALEAQQTAELWTKAFKEIRLSIIDEVLLELEVAANRHAELLGLKGWEIRFETERETTSGSLSYKFTVLLFPPEQDTPVKWESYSGGESQRWQLATTFALSEVLLARAGINPNLEIFDEPTKGLSAQGIDDLLEHLRERAQETDRAIWFVDHHTLDRGSFDGTLLVTKDKEGSNAKWL